MPSKFTQLIRYKIDYLDLSTMSTKRRKLSSGSESSIDLDSFKESASKFNHIEEKALKINVILSNSLFELQDEENDLDLPNFGLSQILVFNPRENTDLNIIQKRFLNKIKNVAQNNNVNVIPQDSAFEALIDDMAIVLFDHLGLDDAERLSMNPSRLEFNIKSDNEWYSFACHADREGKIDGKTIWITTEDKQIRSKSYKHGETQLIVSMIAAFQENISLKEIDTKMGEINSVFGIRIVGTTFWFYKMDKQKEYLDQLNEGLPNIDINVYKWGELSIVDPIQRKTIIRTLRAMRKYILNVIPDPLMSLLSN
jgi:hypothetical protein